MKTFRLNAKNSLVLGFFLFLSTSCATSIVVNSEADDPDKDLNDTVCETINGDCTLRAAIQQANASTNADVITFENVSVIPVNADLPWLTSSNIAIKGAGEVTLDGGVGGCGVGLHVGLWIRNSSYNVISGLTIVNFGSGIRVEASSADARYNIIGINPNSNEPAAAQGNVIGGNCTGVWIYGEDAFNNTLAGNYIGTDGSGTQSNANQTGLIINNGAHNNLIGDVSTNQVSLINTSELISYWALDENGGNAIDAHGSNDLTDSNTVGTGAGVIMGARDFERTQSEFFSHADNSDLSTGDIDFSLSAWIKLESLPSASEDMVIASKYNSASVREYQLWVTADNLVIFRVYTGSAIVGTVTASSFGALSTGVWYHVVAYHDAVNNEIGLSVNSVAVTAATSGAPADTTSAFRIGRNYAGYFFDGLIDEVAFWKRVLSPQEISGLYNNGNGQAYGQGTTAGNVISGNSSTGVLISHEATANHITGNYIGTTASGFSALSNGGDGVTVNASGNIIGIDPTGSGSGNVISGNGGNGVNIQTNNNIVAGNLVGTTADGMSPLGNAGYGISIYGANNNRIGTNGDGIGDEQEGNVISGNGTFSYNDGIRVDGTGTIIAGNYIGTNATGTAALGNYSGIYVVANNNRIGTDGNGTSDQLEANVISGNQGYGISIDGAFNSIAGNFIGTDVTGLVALGNGGDGINLGFNSHDNVIGTDSDGLGDAVERNVISSNGIFFGNKAGITIDGSANIVAGNLIGTDATGLAPLGNNDFGIALAGNNNRVGTNGDNLSDSNETNLISGNGSSAIIIFGPNNWVAGNLIGTDISGVAALPNSTTSDFPAIRLSSSANTIGTDGNGTADANERNVISGNAHNGINLIQSSATNNIVAGNFIGVDATGALELPNNGLGIQISNNASNNRIGTDGNGQFDAAEANVISGNTSDGIMIIVSTANQIAGNFIGTDPSGTAPLGNGRYGVNIDSSNVGNTTGNTIGGSIEKANVIAFNSWSGVRIGGFSPYAIGNPILYNSIHSNGDNGEVGITLQPGDTLYGVTPNDIGDPDVGGNDLMNFPELNTALSINNSVTITGEIVDGLPNANFLIQFFSVPQCDQYSQHGEGEVFLGETTEMTNGSGDVSFIASFAAPVTPGSFITSTATHNNSTSEFSECVEVTSGMTLQGEGLMIVPLQNLNCRYYCTQASDIADTLLEGVQYFPTGWDPATGFLTFTGPSFGTTCYAPPVASGNSLMTLSLAGEPIEVEELTSEIIDIRACPVFPTPTPTLDIDEGENTTETPPPTTPECSDGVDNDGDGRIDYNPTGRGDRECRSASDNDELNP